MQQTSKYRLKPNLKLTSRQTILQDQLEKCKCDVTNRTENIETIDKAISEHATSTNHKISIIPVSYTHLDVYKRQTIKGINII